jgi:hypothetical protein
MFHDYRNEILKNLQLCEHIAQPALFTVEFLLDKFRVGNTIALKGHSPQKIDEIIALNYSAVSAKVASKNNAIFLNWKHSLRRRCLSYPAPDYELEHGPRMHCPKRERPFTQLTADSSDADTDNA